jgi:hypothetical protein
MNLSELGAYLLADDMRDFLRVEALDHYDAESDRADYQRWLDGLPERPSPGKTAWHDRLRRDTANGITWRRIHVLAEPLTDYLLFELEQGYAGNAAAGEDIRILSTSPKDVKTVPELLIVNGGDRVAMSRYDKAGKFVEAHPAGDSSSYWANVAANLWDEATPYEQWWAERPKYHRTRVRQAA